MNRFRPSHFGKETRSHLNAYDEKISEALRNKKLLPGMAISHISAVNGLSDYAQSSILDNIDYSRGYEVPTDENVLNEVKKRVNGDLINILLPATRDLGVLSLYNMELRNFKPSRSAKQPNIPLNPQFSQTNFHYGLKVCDFDEFKRDYRSFNLTIHHILNRYSFSPVHSLWVPNKTEGHNQFIDPDKDSEILENIVHDAMFGELGESVRFGYNASGAHASVNNLHFHMFFTNDSFKMPADKLIENDPQNNFPNARVIPKNNQTVHELKSFIKEVNGRAAKGDKITYCLYMNPKAILAFPRKTQDSPDYQRLLDGNPSFTSGMAFIELARKIILPNRMMIQEIQTYPDDAILRINQEFIDTMYYPI